MFARESLIKSMPPLVEAACVTSHAEWVKYRTLYSIELLDRHAVGYVEVGGYKIAVQLFYAEESVGNCLLLHGYYDHTGLERYLIRYWLEKGYNVATFDLPGHGLSTGESVAIDDFNEYQDVLRAVIEGLRALSWERALTMAQSTGGAIVSHYLLECERLGETPFFEKGVLLAPLVRPCQWYWAKLAYQLISPFRNYVKRSFSKNSNDESFVCFLAEQDPLQSRRLSSKWVGALIGWERYFHTLPASEFKLLIIQGDQDETVNYKYNLKVLSKKFPSSDSVIVPGARHQLMNESPRFLEQIFQHVDRFC